MKKKIGVLVMSYGTPESMDQVEAYYTHIRRGHPPTPDQLEELKSRYEAIGGVFPLRENTNQQVAALEERLNQLQTDLNFICYQGLKHASPYIEDGVKAMAQDGITEAVAIVLAPHYSSMSVGAYIERAKEIAEQVGIKMQFVKEYHLHPYLIDALTMRVEEAMERFDADSRDQVRILFTAHSLPAKILELNDPYVEQLLETSRAISQRTGYTNWQFAWQSAGKTAIPWLGPDILEVISNLHKEGIKDVLVCPIGFVSDHLEVLYDIDIESKQLATELGMHLERTRSLNSDPLYIETLADSILTALKKD
jgi:ferrochelatase